MSIFHHTQHKTLEELSTSWLTFLRYDVMRRYTNAFVSAGFVNDLTANLVGYNEGLSDDASFRLKRQHVGTVCKGTDI